MTWFWHFDSFDPVPVVLLQLKMWERENRRVTVIFDPTSVTAEFDVWIRRNYGETVGVNRSGTAFLLTSNTEVLSPHSKLLLIPFSILLPTLTGIGCWTWFYQKKLFLQHLHWLTGDYWGGWGGEKLGERGECEGLRDRVCVCVCVCIDVRESEICNASLN